MSGWAESITLTVADLQLVSIYRCSSYFYWPDSPSGAQCYLKVSGVFNYISPSHSSHSLAIWMDGRQLQRRQRSRPGSGLGRGSSWDNPASTCRVSYRTRSISIAVTTSVVIRLVAALCIFARAFWITSLLYHFGQYSSYFTDNDVSYRLPFRYLLMILSIDVFCYCFVYSHYISTLVSPMDILYCFSKQPLLRYPMSF